MTAKQKYSIGGVFLLAVVSYFFAFRKTIQLKRQYKSLVVNEQLYNSTPIQLKKLHEKDKAYDDFLASYNISSGSITNDLLEVLHTLAVDQKLLIENYSEPHIYINEETKSKTITNTFTLKGGYNGIIELLYKMEQEYTFGNITHVNFEKQKNYRTGKYHLFCEVHLQRLSSF